MLKDDKRRGSNEPIIIFVGSILRSKRGTASDERKIEGKEGSTKIQRTFMKKKEKRVL
jgi:hypothetical protein